jgi:hypothetical protein
MSKVREVTVPLPIEHIKEFFQDKEIEFLVDYENSKIKDQVFLTYISNLDIPMDIKVNENFDKESLFKLIDHYMTVKTITNIPFLNSLARQIILTAAGSKAGSEGYLSTDQLQEYISTRKDTIAIWLAFFNSIPLFLISTFKELNEELKVQETYEVIDDIDAVGLNIVNLLTNEFMADFFTTEVAIEKSFWFKQQFESYMFKGKSLYNFAESNLRSFIGLMVAVHDGHLPPNAADYFNDKELDKKVAENF